MAAESILTNKRPGFPKISKGKDGVKTVIEYIGETTTLSAAEPSRDAEWGDYAGTVSRTHIEGIDNTDHSILIVNMNSPFDAEGDGNDPETAGTAQEITYEIDWTMFQRSIFEHPSFVPDGGGQYALQEEDIAQIQLWEAMENSTLKKDFQFYPDPANPVEVSLSDNAVICAKLILKGIDTWEDYAPVLRKTTTYAGGNPSTTDAGLRDISGPVFSGKPVGYEWRKTADRSVRTDRDTRWNQIEEWTGGLVIYLDREEIFI